VSKFRFKIVLMPLLAAWTAGCSIDIGTTGFVNDRVATARVSTREAVLLPNGVCEADLSLDPAAARPRATSIALGIGECDLVRLKAVKPDDVLIGESGRGQRETQVLYAEPGGRELYLFTDNKLTRIVKPGEG
jgi:hypothetical protein